MSTRMIIGALQQNQSNYAFSVNDNSLYCNKKDDH